jgi:predicted DCC family thiol-disulfide oxidoreductase YuxK
VSGFTPAELGQIIHAQWADGRVIMGIAVFQAMWEAVGFGLLTKVSRLAFIEPLLFKAYSWFAQNRLWLTGRVNSCPANTCAQLSSKTVKPVT